MRILTIYGSPRKDGNTAQLTGKLLEGLSAGAAVGSTHEFRAYWLNEMQIRPCQACFQCFKTGRCALEDDMQRLYPEFQPADLVIFAVPIYWWHMNAQTKLCFDRMTALLSKEDRLPALLGKSMALVTAYNYRHCAECTIKMFEEFREWINVRLSLVEYCAMQGPLSAHPEKLEEAYQLGLRLANQTAQALADPLPAQPEAYSSL